MGGDWKKCCTITVIFISLVSLVIVGIIYIETPINQYRGVNAICKAEKILPGYIQLLSGTSIKSSKITNVIIVIIVHFLAYVYLGIWIKLH